METVKVEPHVEYALTNKEDVVCGESVPVGFDRVIWTYPNKELSAEQYYQLYKQTDGAASGSVYIRVPTREVSLVGSTYQVTYATYAAVMHWPEEGLTRGKYDRWEIPEIEFTNLVAT
jgi:hypothetical protein